jgi:hypothetical protein
MIGNFPGSGWFTYVALDGRVLLKHRCRTRGESSIPCPHCGKPLEISEYQAQCCDQQFKTSFGDITQQKPIGVSQETPRGWKSLRPWPSERWAKQKKDKANS